jgi:hypothetical protein
MRRRIPYYCARRLRAGWNNRLAGRCIATAAAESNVISSLNQHYNNGDPYDPQFDSLRRYPAFCNEVDLVRALRDGRSVPFVSKESLYSVSELNQP